MRECWEFGLPVANLRCVSAAEVLALLRLGQWLERPKTRGALGRRSEVVGPVGANDG